MGIGTTAALLGWGVAQCQWIGDPSAFTRSIRTSDACSQQRTCTLKWNANEHLIRKITAHCPSINLPSRKLDPDRPLLGIQLSENLKNELAAIQYGANQAFPYPQAADYWKSNPEQKPSVALNRSLTARYGAQKTSEIFFAYHRQSATTRALERAMQQQFEHPTAFETLKTTKILFIPGSGVGDPFQSPAFERTTEGQLLGIALANGLPVRWVATLSLGPLAQNIKRVQQFLSDELSSPEPAVVIAMSRGVTEFFSAIPSLPKQKLARIRALMNISGLVRGSFVATWSEQWGPLQFLSPMQELSNRKIEKLYRKGKTALSQIPFILNVVGLGPPQIISRDAQIARMQNLLIRPFIPEAGVNDGYVEYPETLIPRLSPAQRNMTLPIAGSHILIDAVAPHQSDAFVYALLKSFDTQIR